jgi:hypothetical protein
VSRRGTGCTRAGKRERACAPGFQRQNGPAPHPAARRWPWPKWLRCRSSWRGPEAAWPQEVIYPPLDPIPHHQAVSRAPGIRAGGLGIINGVLYDFCFKTSGCMPLMRRCVCERRHKPGKREGLRPWVPAPTPRGSPVALAGMAAVPWLLAGAACWPQPQEVI